MVSPTFRLFQQKILKKIIHNQEDQIREVYKIMTKIFYTVASKNPNRLTN